MFRLLSKYLPRPILFSSRGFENASMENRQIEFFLKAGNLNFGFVGLRQSVTLNFLGFRRFGRCKIR